jgi:hypothetical protein
VNVAALLLAACCLLTRGDLPGSMLAAQGAARRDYWFREFMEYRAREGVAWMQAGDPAMETNIRRVLCAHGIDFLCEGSLAWCGDVLPWDAQRARAALLADPQAPARRR